MRNYLIAVTSVIMLFSMIAGHADAGVVLANNIPTNFQFTSFRGDVGFNDPPQFPNTADGQLFVAQTSGKVESIISVIENLQPGQSVPLDVGNLCCERHAAWIPDRKPGANRAFGPSHGCVHSSYARHELLRRQFGSRPELFRPSHGDDPEHHLTTTI